MTADGYTPEALRVGHTLKHDFEKAGIHLPEEQRSKLTGLIDLERRIGMQIGVPHLCALQDLWCQCETSEINGCVSTEQWQRISWLSLLMEESAKQVRI